MATMRSLGFSIFSRYDGSGVREARRDMDSFNGSVNRSTSAMNSWTGRIILATKALMVFGPALVPIAAHMTAIGGAATAMGASVGGALTVYGAAMKGAITSTMDAKEKISGLREELNKQKATLATLKPGTEAYNKQLKEVAATQKELDAALKALSPSQRSFIQATDEMSGAWKKFIDATKDKTLATATNVVQGLTAGIGLLKPILDAVHPVILKVSKDFENWMKGDSAKNYANLIKASAVPALQNLVAAGKDVINVLGDGFRAFLPQGKELSETIRNGARALREWSDGGGFQRFLQYVREVAPQVKEFWRTFGEALSTILRTMKELGPFALGLVTTILRLVAALPPEWIETIVKGFVAWKVAMAGLMIMSTIATLVRSLAAAWFVLNLAFSTSAIGLVIIAIAALVAGIILLIKNWDTVSAALKTAWNATWNFLKQVAEAVWNALKIAWNAVCTAFSTVWQAVSGALSAAWNTIWNGIKTAAEVVWNALKIAWNAVVTVFQTVWNTVSTVLSAAWGVFWNGLKTAAEVIWNALKTAWSAVWTAIQTVWDTFKAVVTAAWNIFWNALKTAAELVWNALKTAWSALWTALTTAWNTFKTVVQAAWNIFWNALKTAAELVWNALKTAWSALWTALTTAWNTFKTVITTAWNLFWTALKTAAELVWNALKTAWSALWTALQLAWDTFKNALTTAWDLFWNAIKTAAETIWNGLKELWQGFIDAIQAAWDTFSSAFEEAWSAVWETAKGVAEDIWHGIGEVIETAVNAIIGIINGIIDAWNTISSAVGLDGLNIGNIGEVSLNFAVGGIVGEVPKFETGGVVNFANGGVLPGYAPGRDTVPAMLSRGEGILVPEAVKGLGANFVHAANYHFSHGRGGRNVNFPGYAGGGIVSFARDPQNKEGWGTSFFQGGGVVDPDDAIRQAQERIRNGVQIEAGFRSGLMPSAGGDDDDGGGLFGSGIGPDFGPDLTPGDNIGDTFKNMIPGMSGLGGAVLGFIGRAAIEAAFDFATSALDAFGMAGNVGKMLAAGTKKIVLQMIEFLVAKDEAAKQEYEAMSVAGAQSVSAWGPLAAQALAMAGLDPSQLPAFLALMAAESGGNPNAINGWDINAKNGVPSQGLMQVIPPTFAAYHVPGTSNNILDPLANMAASANYIKARYGGRVPGSPYADGTDNATPGMHLVGEEGPELVTSPGYANFGGGEQVLPAAETASVLGGGAPAPVAGGAMAAGGIGAATGGGAASEVQAPGDVFALIQQLLASAQQLQKVLTSMWAQVVSTTNSSWQNMHGTAFAPLNANLTGTVPTSLTTMGAAWTAGLTNVAATTTAQWTAMDATAFTPMNAMMSTTVPLAATTMGTLVTTTATQMGTDVTASTTAMQGSVQESWGQMEAGTETSWTNIETSISDSVNAATTPINGLLTGFNNVSSSLGMGVNVPLIAFADGGMVPFAKGGVMPGYAPGKDRIPAILSPGEGVLTPEAVRGLGGPGFVYAANAKWSGHRGAGKGGNKFNQYANALGGCQHFANGGIAMSMGQQKKLLPGGVADPHTGRMQFFSGTITPIVAEGLAEAGLSAGMVTQGSFSTGVAASAGTHDGDGVVDIGSTSVEQQMRDVGWAAWTRGNGDGMSPHTHGVYMRATGISPAAMGQVIDYINGGSGLGAGSASAAELAGWGLGLGEWNFGPLLKDLVDLTKTNVPEVLRTLVRKKLTAEQVRSGFAEKKAALDAMNVGQGPWADGLRGMGTRSHDGVVDYVSNQATAFDGGGWWAPGTLAYNGTSRPELAIPADELEDIANHIKGGGNGGEGCIHVDFTFNGPVNDGDDVRRAMNEAIPKLRTALQAGSGKRAG